MKDILKVSNVSMGYNQAMVLHNVDFHVREGEQVFIVGRNGAGKTSFLKTICGLLKAKEGSIIFDDKEISHLTAEKIAQSGLHFVAQDKVVFRDLTVRMNIALAAHAKHIELKTAIADVLKLYPKLKDFLELNAGNLSGGQREILLIGRAIVGSPKLLLIDEPTEGLAAKVIDDIFAILAEIKNETSTIIVEQNLSIVTQLADRIYVMKEGKIIKEIDNADRATKAEDLEQYL